MFHLIPNIPAEPREKTVQEFTVTAGTFTVWLQPLIPAGTVLLINATGTLRVLG